MSLTNLTKNIDGESISKSIGSVIDKIRYRKYAKKGFTLVVWINKENTLVKLLDGHIREGLLQIPSQDATKIIDKVYIAPSKKIVTRLVFVKEDINSTLDITITDMSKISTELFKRFVGIKILDDLQSFNMGQVLLGGAIGTILGFFLCLGSLVVYGMLL